MRSLVLLLPAVLLVVYFSMLQANTIHVPGEQPTIRDGIWAAVDGDTVLVADGKYTGSGNRDISFMGKAIVVMSENGPEHCIIDCQGNFNNPHKGFYFRDGEHSNSVLKGFTITNGWFWQGGGIYCHSYSSPTIENNTIRGNGANSGGGIYCGFHSNPTITGNRITGNTANENGGGIYCQKSSPVIRGNIIAENTAGRLGGGIYCFRESYPFIEGNTITRNTANVSGGGLYLRESSPIMINTILWADSAASNNEIYKDDSSFPVVSYSDIQGGWVGEGVFNSDPFLLFPETRDYRLPWDSPCVDAGHPDSIDTDGTRKDIGAHFFDQNDYLTLYVTPDKKVLEPGDIAGATFTVINRWDHPESFWFLSQVLLPDGGSYDVLGPEQYTIPSSHTEQIHVTHPIPMKVPIGVYESRSLIGIPHSTLYDWDSFTFIITN